MKVSLNESIPLVTQTVTSSLSRPGVSSSELQSAFKCLETWITILRPAYVEYVAPVVMIIDLLCVTAISGL